MQANTIVVSSVGAGKSYGRFQEETNRTTYHENGHTVATRDQVQLYRTEAKPNGESRGSSKCSFKVTLDEAVPNRSGSGTIVLPNIVEVSFSVPVGSSRAGDLIKTVQDILNNTMNANLALNLVQKLDI